MLRSATRSLPTRALFARQNARWMSQQVPSDAEQQAGRRRLEMDAEAKGQVRGARIRCVEWYLGPRLAGGGGVV